MPQNPALIRHRLRTELRRSRETRELTQRQVAKELDWSTSKVIRIENGETGISTTDVKALAGVLEIEDRIGELVDWAKAARRQPFSEYGDVLSSAARSYFGYEASASIIRQFEPNIVPGLLQTPEYTRTLLQEVYGLPADEIDQHLEIREQRQQVLTLPTEERKAFFVMSEAVLRWPVGGIDTMRQQIEYLATMAMRPGVFIQVLPFRAGAHFGLRGPFVWLEFFEPGAPNMLYLENAAGSRTVRDDPKFINPYREGFQSLERLASAPDELEPQLGKALELLGN